MYIMLLEVLTELYVVIVPLVPQMTLFVVNVLIYVLGLGVLRH